MGLSADTIDELSVGGIDLVDKSDDG